MFWCGVFFLFNVVLHESSRRTSPGSSHMLSSVRKVSLIEGETLNGRQRRRELYVLFGKSPCPPSSSPSRYVFFFFHRFATPSDCVCMAFVSRACVFKRAANKNKKKNARELETDTALTSARRRYRRAMLAFFFRARGLEKRAGRVGIAKPGWGGGLHSQCTTAISCSTLVLMRGTKQRVLLSLCHSCLDF